MLIVEIVSQWLRTCLAGKGTGSIHCRGRLSLFGFGFGVRVHGIFGVTVTFMYRIHESIQITPLTS